MRTFFILISFCCWLCANGLGQTGAENKAEDGTIAPHRDDMKPLQLPDLSAMEELVQSYMGDFQEQLKTALAQEPRDEGAISEAYAKLGEVYQAHQMLNPAEVCYKNALILKNNRFQTQYLLAKIYQSRGEIDKAEAAFIKAKDISPNFTPLWWNLGELNFQKNEFEKSRAYFQKLTEENSESPAGWHGLARVAMSMGELVKAVSLFEKTLEILPGADRVHYSLATAHRRLGNMDKAKMHMKQAGKIGVRMKDPILEYLEQLVESERIHIIRGRFAFNAGAYEGAVAEFQKAVEANPASTIAKVNLGTALGLLGKTEAAMEQYRQVLELAPDHQTAHYNLGRLHSRLKQMEKAEEHLRKAADLNPSDEEALTALADLLRDKGAIDEAFKRYGELAEVNPNSETAAVQRALLLMRKQDYAGAGNLLRESHERNPTQGQLAHFYARFLASSPNPNLRDGNKALVLAQKVFQASPTLPHLETLAMAHAQAGDCQQAASLQLKALEVAKKNRREDLMVRIQADLKRYQSEKPCHPL